MTLQKTENKMRGPGQVVPRALIVTLVMMAATMRSACGQRVQFYDTVFHVEEGKQFSVRVDLFGTITEEVRVIVEVQGDVGDDFIGDTQVATFTPSTKQATVTFTVRDDDEPEDRERFTISLFFIDENLFLGEPRSATVYIEASDDAYGVFSFVEESPVLVTEKIHTTSVSLRVQRTVSFFGNIKVTYVVEDITEQRIVDLDISPTTGSVTFVPTQREAFIQLQIKPDGIPEDDESFIIRLLHAEHDARINVSEVILIIQANDAPIRFSQATYVYDEGPGSKTWNVEVYRGIDEDGNTVGLLNSEVILEYRFVDVTALARSDFSSSDGELIFSANETVKTIAFVIEDDNTPEMRETFKIRLFDLKGEAVFVSPSEAEVVINANDDSNGKITFEPVREGSDETPVTRVNEDTYTVATFTVLRKRGTFGEVSVGWELQRSDPLLGDVTQDVGPTSGVLVFGEGEGRKEIEVTIVQDSQPEPAERFELTLLGSSVTGSAVVDGITTAYLVLEDSDNVYGTVEFGPDTSHEVDIDTSPRALKLAVTRNGGRQDSVLVNINVTYVDDDIEALPENIFEKWAVTATLPPGRDPVVVAFNILPSAFLTIGGQFQASMDSPRLLSEPKYGSYNSPNLGIRDQIIVAVSEAEANGETGFNNTAPIVVEEPESGTLEVPLLIIREGMSGRAVITWSITGVGASENFVDDKDVAALRGTINIESGFSSVELVVVVQADDVPEINETMKVRLERIEPSFNQRLRPGSREINITVLRNDNPGGVFQFSPVMKDAYNIEEGSQPIEVIVERVGGDLETRSVQLVVEPDGSSEFYGTPNALVFKPGERTRKATILARNEGKPELAEYFTLKLVPLGNSTLGDHTSISITVLESDFPYGQIQFKDDPTIIIISETVEGKPVNVSIAVERDRGTFYEVTVPWKLSPETDEDLRPSSGTIVFAPGQSSYTLTLQTVDDEIPERDETYAVQLGQPIGGAVAGIPMVATVTIRENDNPVVFTENLVQADEPGTHVFTVQRSGNLNTAVTVAYRTLDGSASMLEGDYREIFRETLSFGVGESTKTFSVTVLDDSVPEGNETFTLELFDATGDLLITEHSRTTVMILANDDAYGVFSFEVPDNRLVEEGSTIYYQIIRSRGIFGAVEVSWEIRSLQNIAVAEGSEFDSTRGTVVFQAQESRRALGITPLADQLPEGQEVFRIVLTSVRVVKGISGRSLARLAASNLQMDIVVLASDDPTGRFAFPPASQELSVAEDYYPGDEGSMSTTFTVERRQGTQGAVQVLWEIFSEPFGTNLPKVYDLLFTGERSSSVSSVPSRQREGTGTFVYSFSGATDSYITIPSVLEPSAQDLSEGFTISAWVQPSLLCDGYIVAHGPADGSALYYGLRLIATASSTTLDMTLSSESSGANPLGPVVTGSVVQDGHWHQVLVAVGNASIQFYLDGTLINSSSLTSGVPSSGAGVLLVGARPPSTGQFEGYMQDVRIWARTFDSGEAKALYHSLPLNDMTPLSGVLTYPTGVRTQSFTVRSLQDIEEEGDEVFSVTLMAATGGASLSLTDSRTTLTVLKSDNANGLFGFREPCTPVRIEDESAKLVCNVQRQRGDDGTVNVTWLIQQRTAVGLTSADSDFDDVTGLIVFLRGERLKTFEVQITEETVPELDELFEVRLASAISADGIIGSTNTSGASINPTMQSSSVTIVANDYPYGLFQFGQKVGMPPTPDENGRVTPTEEVPTVRVGEEGGTVSLVVERAQGTLGAVSVEWRTVDKTALSEGKIPPDYVVNGAAGRVDFVNGQLYEFVNVTIRDNSIPEGEKMFQVELVNPTGGAAIGKAGSVMVVVNASDNAFGVYQFDDGSLKVQAQETGDVFYKSVFLKVVRLGGSIGPDTVSWEATEDEDDGLDLTESSGTVQFAAGQTEANLEIKVRGDTEPELDEVVQVKLIQVAKGALGDSLKCSSMVTIEANDDPYGYFVIINLQRPVRVEEEAKDISITVRRLYGTFGSVSVAYQTLAPDETYNYLPGPLLRANHQDFVATSGNITFEQGQEFGTFTVKVLDDTDPEQDESVFVRLTDTYLLRAAQFQPVTNSPRLGLESESYAQIIISSNDDASGVLQLSPTALTVVEGVEVPQIRVVRSGGTFGEVTVQFQAINGKAQNQLDFELLSRQVILTPGEASKLLPIIIIDDRIPELSETFTVELLEQITGGATLGENRSAVITIEPSDDPNGVFGFASSGMSVEEPENGQPYKVAITVARTGGSVDVVTLYWTTTLNGEPLDSDITPTSGSIFFVSNEGSLSISVSILPDDIPEGTENIAFTLLSATNGGRVGDQNTFILSIAPNDSPHGYVQFASPSYTVQEGPVGPQDLELTRSGGTYGRLRVYFSTRVVDVVSEATQDGSTVLSYFSVPVSGQRDEQGTPVDVGGETDQLLACSSACLATEACQSFQFGHTVSSVTCQWFTDVVDNSQLIPAVNLSVYSKDTEKVQLVLSRIAKPGEDYSSVTENSVLVPDGNATGQLPVTILDDGIPELKEMFNVVLLRVEVDDPSAVTRDPPSIGQVSTAVVTIATNDNANGAFRIYSDSPTANLEQRTVSYQEQDRLAVDLIVEREGGSIGEVTVTWQVNTEGRTATYGTDFLANGATLTFTPGQTRSFVTVTILDDAVPEDDEQFTVQLMNPGGGASVGSDSYVTVIILANDNVAGVLAFNTTSILAQEGDQIMVGVERSKSTLGTVQVRWTIEGLNGLQPHLGFREFTGSLTFLPGESKKTITLAVLSDDTPEINEEYQLKLLDIKTEGVGDTGAAIIDPLKGIASITIKGSNDPHGLLQFASTSLSVAVAEDAGSVALQIDRKFGAIGTVRVSYQAVQGALSTLNANLGLASPGEDFTAVGNSYVDIPDGVTSATVSVTIINDLLPEIDEVFLVRLIAVSLVGSVDETSPPRLATSGTVAEVKVGANDGAQGVLVFASQSRSVQVDEVTPVVTLTVLRTEGTFGQVSVAYYAQSITQDTNAGTDYRLDPGELVFAAGESQKFISIQIINDNLAEPHEQFEIVLSSPKDGAILGLFVRAAVTILANDDSAGHVTFVSPARVELQEPRAGNEAGSKVELSVQRGPGIFGRVTVPFVITNLFDIPTTDVSPASGVVVFEDRQATAVIELTAVDDDDPETEEEFVVKLRTPTNGAQLGNVTEATVIVRQSDSPYGLFQIYPANTRLSSLDVEESVGTVRFDITRSKGLRGRVTVDVATNSANATFLSSSNNVILAELQSVPAAKISAWHLIETGEATFILMLTSLNAEEQLKDLLPDSSRVEVGQSVLFRWQGELIYVRTLATDGATAADSFRVAGSTYFVITNAGKEGGREVQSLLYRLYSDGSVEVVQGLTTFGATDVKHFVHGDQLYLAVANALDDSSRSDIHSFVYTWSSATQRFRPSASQQVPTLYARGVDVFVIDGVVYLAVANYYDRVSSSYEIKSVVYRREADGSFVQHQRLSSTGARDVAYFTTGGAHYLLVASNRQDVISSPQTSHLYRWDAATRLFVQHQTLSTSRVAAVRVLTLQDQTVILAIANSVGASKILQWNAASHRFETVWSGDPYLMLQPMSIQQPQGALYLLATANVITENDGMLYQLARISNESDFVQRRVTLTFEPDQTELHTTAVILQDERPEDTESFTVDLVNPRNGAEIGPQASVMVNILSNDNAHGIIQFAADSVNVFTNEKDGMDNLVLLSVMREGGIFGRVVVQWIATGDHDGIQDIYPLSGTVEFGDGVSVSTIALTIKDDAIAELAEVTFVRLTQIVDDGTSLPSGGARFGEATQATVTVLANDSPYGVVSWDKTAITTSEPEGSDRMLTLTMKREQGLRGELRVSYVTSMALELPEQQQATSGEDFTPTQGIVTFAADIKEASVSVVIKQDNIPEASETFFVNITEVSLVTSSGGSSAQPSIRVPGNVVQITILENDGARGIVQLDVETNVEGRVDTYEEYGRNNTLKLVVRRSMGLLGSLVVSWQTNSITANNLDYFPNVGNVRFEDGQETAEISITIVDDIYPEDMESFEVMLIRVTGDAQLGSITTVRIAILKNDSPTGLFKFSPREVEIHESRSLTDSRGRAVVIVKRVQGSQGLVNVRWRLSAEAQEDFIPPLEGTVQFLQGQLERTFSVQSRPDGLLEGRETFLVSLQSADNNANISPTESDAKIIILPDPGASGTISILPESRSVLIGEPGEYNPAYDGTARIELSRAEGIYGEVEVTWTVSPRDTTAFLQVQGSVKFLDLQQTATIVLQARDDSQPELRASYVLQVTSASGGAVISPEAGAAMSNILYVASDYPHGLFEFSLPETVSVSEDENLVKATVRRSKGLVGQVQVGYSTSEGTAKVGQDFYPAAGVLVFENGVDSQIVQVSLKPDDIAEGPETFFINITSVRLLNPSDSDFTGEDGLQRDMPPEIGAVAAKVVIIKKNDNAEGIIEFENKDVNVQEEAGVGQISVVRRVGSYGTVTVSYETRAISASAGVDYLPASGTVQLKDGQETALINVTLLDDAEREFEEQFSITLTNPTGGALLGNERIATVTIVKSDFPNGKFSFLGEPERSIPNPSTDQSLTFYIERTEGVLGQQEVFWRIMGPNNPSLPLSSTADIGHMTSGVETTSGRFTWGDGEAGSKQFTLTIKRYTSEEIAKTFVIEIYSIQANPATVGNGEVGPTAGKVVLTVEKFGHPNGIIEFTGGAMVVREQQEPEGTEPYELGFPVIRQVGTGSEGVLKVHWEVRGPSGLVTDVSPQNGTLLLGSGVRQGQINLQILPDDLPELTEDFTMVLTYVEGGAELNLQASQAKFHIRYNDNPHGLFGIMPDHQQVAVDPMDLSRSLDLNFTRHGGTFGTVVLTYNAVYDVPQSGIELPPSPGTVTFEEGQDSVAASLRILGTGFMKLGTTFTLTLREVRYQGGGMTDPPRLKAGETEARIPVPSLAANSEISFLHNIVNINDEEGTGTLTIVRSGVYGTVSVDWTAGQLEAGLRPGVTNGQITPSTGSVSIAHGADSRNFTVQVTPRVGQAEMFVMRLPRMPETPARGGARLAAQNRQVTLDPAGVVRFMPGSLQPRVSEVVGQVMVSVCRVYGVSGKISVTYSTEDITAQGSIDYSVIRNSHITMQDGQPVVNITLVIFRDDVPEQSEQFSVDLQSVDQVPTATRPFISPRLDSQYTTSVVTISESNDPYGVLWFETEVFTRSEQFVVVPLKIRRTGGVFGQVSVKVRTVGGGEVWTSEIVMDTDNTTRDTIGQALGQRRPGSEAKKNEDYKELDLLVIFQAEESTKTVNLVLLEDTIPEPQESVLVYLTQATGGARVARGTPDGGKKGFAEIVVKASDLSNGIIGFDEQSKRVEADEDVNPTITLTLIRLNADYGNVEVFWKAKMRETSSAEEDGQLVGQLEAVTGSAICSAYDSLCDLTVRLKDDSIPEESFTFVVKLDRVGDDAKLNNASLFATITVLPSDNVRGLLQIVPSDSMVIVGDEEESARIGVQRVQGKDYDVTVAYRTRMMLLPVEDTGISIYLAQEADDYEKKEGILVFMQRSEAIQYVTVKLTPMTASSDLYPKQFYIDIHTPTNGARVNSAYNTSTVRIVQQSEVDVFKIISRQRPRPLNDSNLLQTLGGLDGQAQGPLSDNEVKLIDDMIRKVNDEGNRRQLPGEVLDTTLDLLCKLLDPSRADGTRGYYALAQRMDEFAHTLLTGRGCPATPPVDDELITKTCAYVKVSAGRWHPVKLQGYEYTALYGDTFSVPSKLTLSTASDGIDDECVDFHIVEYSSRQWFPTQNGEDLLHNRVMSFGVKGKPSGDIAEPVEFRIHTPDNRIAAKQAKCVYFDLSLGRWVNPSEKCTVRNNLRLATDNFVDCSCGHMTNYAVIADAYDSDIIGYALWFYITSIFCMSCIAIVIVAHHLCHKRPTFAASLIQHMLFAIFATQLCLALDAYFSPGDILTASVKEDNERCIAVGLFLHYFFLTQFMWIMVQSINFWSLLVLNDEHTERKYMFFFLLGWGLPLLYVAAFYAVTFNIYKYTTDLAVDHIYGDVYNNGEICFLTNAYTAVGGIIVPVLLILLLSGIIFIKVFQLIPQWQAYDDVYRGRYNITEVRLLLVIWALVVLTWLWGGLHMVYGQLWYLVLYCSFDIVLGLLILVLYGILRNPVVKVCGVKQKSYYAPSNMGHTDIGSLPPPSVAYSDRLVFSNNTINMLKGSRTSLINDAWERGTIGGRSQMTVRRALPSQVYLSPPPIAIVSPAHTSELDPKDLDELLFALKSGHDYTPSELSRSIADDDSQLSTKLDRYETKRIDIADTHL